MRPILPVSAVLLAMALALSSARAADAPASSARETTPLLRSGDSPPPPISADDVPSLPCVPGVIRPKAVATPLFVIRPSKLLEEQEREVSATRTRTEEFQRVTDEAVGEAWARELEASSAKFADSSRSRSSCATRYSW